MVIYIAYKIAQAVILMLPLRFSYWLAERLADFHYYTSKKDRNLVLANLRAVVGEEDERKLARGARQTMRNFAKYLVEFLRFSKMDREYIKKNVETEGEIHIKEALRLNKGAILFSAHLGNWEWGAAIVAGLGYPINVIALAHKDKRVNRLFIAQRAKKGVKNIPLGGSVKKTIKLLSENELIAILADRDFSNNSVDVSLFGRPAGMPVGISIFAIRTGCPILPVFIARQNNDTHKLIIEKPLEYGLTGNNQEDIKDISQRAINIIEKYVRLYPDQWFIFENPWKAKNV